MPDRIFLSIVLACLTQQALCGEAKRTLTPQSCTEVRYLAPDELTSRPALQMSRDGKQVSYVVQVPNLRSDEYDDSLYVAGLGGPGHAQPRSVIVGALITAVSWFPDNRHLAILTRLRGHVVLVRVDSATGRSDVISEKRGDITDYSMDASGNTIAIAVKVDEDRAIRTHTATQLRDGYRLNLGSVAPYARPRRRIYVLHRSGPRWSAEPPLSFVSPLSAKRLSDITDNHAMHINISPNGHYLLLDNIEPLSDVGDAQRVGWEASPAISDLRASGGVAVLNYLYDLRTHNTSMPLMSPIVRSETWAADSKSYVAVAVPPVGSRWEQQDLAAGAPSLHSTHLFSVDIQTGLLQEVLRRAERPPVAWTQSGDLEVQDETGNIHVLNMTSDNGTEEG